MLDSWARYVPESGLSNAKEAEMWVSRRTDYATRAVLALARADGGPLKLEQLAETTEAPRSVLEQVMPVLRAAGVVRSTRGPEGGYRLRHAPQPGSLPRASGSASRHVGRGPRRDYRDSGGDDVRRPRRSRRLSRGRLGGAGLCERQLAV